jgi:hypothetical protein
VELCLQLKLRRALRLILLPSLTQHRLALEVARATLNGNAALFDPLFAFAPSLML